MIDYFETTYVQNEDIDSGAAEQITATSTPVKGGVYICAPSSNSGVVYVGGSDVSATNGVPVSAGQVIPWYTTDLSTVYAIGSADNQKIAIFGGK